METSNGSPLSFLKSRAAQVLTAALVLQATLFYASSRSENIPSTKPLREFPAQIADWRLYQEGYVDQETQAVLKADDTLTRSYTGPASTGASLFIAFFKTQRTGQAPHSPKNCLPGSGWEPSATGALDVDVPGQSAPIRVNRYVVSKGESQSVVLYWYQSRDRVIASEYAAKVYLVADSIRYNRSDTALVRVIVPVVGRDEQKATGIAIRFVKDIFPALRRQLPA
ncbi:MAG: exosortase C-terminal domain/associated protein EpsI [Bryobacteraceae bacterium]